MQQVASIDILNKEQSEKNFCKEKDFTYVFETYYKRVYNYIYYRINAYHTAEDLTSQVFEKVMVKIDTYCEEKAQFEVWLFAIARNVVNDYFRDLKKCKLFSIDKIRDLISNKGTPEKIIEIEETTDELLKALKILDEREKNIVALKFGANLKNVEIAEVLDITESNVGVILYRTMKKLKSKLERGDGFE
ncbi:sigma-70 family RNA polymerase sigma factor [Tissierella praeacuta]|uniref:sigma-70 family RNA polymerase sigma factor n=1 Tax=Tissierella praeacuta TaxID=43131 RepID=UPI003342A051